MKSQTRLSDFTFTFMHWRRKWQPTPVFLPGESQGQGSLVGCCLWGCTESDTTEATWQQQQDYSSEKAMGPHSSTLAWKIPWMEEPGRLQSMDHEESDTTERLHFHFHALEKEMAPRSSVLAWRIPETGEPGGPPSVRSHRVRHD